MDATKCCCLALGGILKRSHTQTGLVCAFWPLFLRSAGKQRTQANERQRIKLCVVKEEKAEQRSRGGEVGGLFLGTPL